MIRVLASLFLVLALAVPASAADKPSFTLGVSIWTGWMPFYLMDSKGILAKRCEEEGVTIKIEKFKDYLASVQAFSSGKLDGCAVTIMDALQPAGGGIDVKAILVNDFSNGGDGILAKTGLELKDIKGKEVLLEQGSVSHYLLIKALEANGLTEGQVVIKNIGGDDAGKAFISGNADFAVTWNPHLYMAEDSKKGKVVYSSKEIPGEIIDLTVWNGKKLDPKAGRALVNAWYDTMKMINDPATRKEAIKVMAAEAGTTPEDFEKLMAGTDIFFEPKRCADFMKDPKLATTLESVKKFLNKHEKLDDLSANITFDPQFIPAK